MPKNRRMQLLSFLCVILCCLFLSCKEKDALTNKKSSNTTIVEERTTLITKNEDSIYIDNSKLIINLNGEEKKYNDLVVNTMLLTTSLVTVSNNKFYLVYDYSASSTKMQHIYKYIYNQGLFLMYKEIIKLNREYSGANRIYLSNYKITNQGYDNLEIIGDTIPFEYYSEKENARTTLYDSIGSKIGTIYYNTSNIDRYIESPIIESNPNNIKKIEILNELEATNTAYYLEQKGAYDQGKLILF